MGQTLTHGIYLPDEGERNCYAGLAGNWQLLDGAVGTIAEHSTQIAGKAPLVHTHVKADITDLFNSANTWTEANTYSKALTVERSTDSGNFINIKHTRAELGSLPSSDQSITWAFKDKNDDNLCYAKVYYETTGGNSFRIFVRNKYASGAPSTSGTVDYAYFAVKINADKSKEGVLKGTFRPYDNNAYGLGTSSYKWKSLNGVNPGALSLPSSDSADYIDLSSNLSTNAEYLYTAPYDGWLCLYVNVNEFFEENAVGLYRSDTSANLHQWAKSVTAAVNLYKQNRYQGSVMLPVESGKKYICYISLNANATIHSKYLFFYKNKGNV